MSNMKLITEKSAERPPSRRAYIRPALTEFGPVGALTQSGSTGAAEFEMNGVCNPGQPNRNDSLC